MTQHSEYCACCGCQMDPLCGIEEKDFSYYCDPCRRHWIDGFGRGECEHGE